MVFRALFVKNLRYDPRCLFLAQFHDIICVLTRGYSYNVTPEELFDLFGKFGPVRYVLET